MWPKLAFNLVETLLPHVGPAIGRAMTGKPDDSAAVALQQATEDMQHDISQVTASYESLYRQLNAQSETLSTLGSNLRSTQLTLEVIDLRLARIERSQTIVARLALLSAVLLVAGLIAVGIFLALHAHTH